ncbi:MAG TPA: hypothetical protein VNE16_00375 [Vicinamibacterales bacterium]|nr:hypothetical protein [Vicinamibacterales bacterium]
MFNDFFVLLRWSRRRWLWLAGGLLVAAAAVGLAARYRTFAMPPQPSVAPTISHPHTFMLAGRVTESAPTTDIGLPNVRIQVSRDGKLVATATSGADGSYYLQGLVGNTEVHLSLPGYLDTEQQIDLFRDETVDFAMKPVPTTISQTVTGEARPTDPRCYLIHGCQVYTLNAHYDGPLQATLTWPNDRVYLMLQLYDPDGGRILAEGQNLFVVQQDVQAALTAGIRYQLRVVYEGGSEPTPYTLVLTHPN